MAQSVFLCLTRPVFSQEREIFNVIVRNKSIKPYHYLDSYRVISTVVSSLLCWKLTPFGG